MTIPTVMTYSPAPDAPLIFQQSFYRTRKPEDDPMWALTGSLTRADHALLVKVATGQIDASPLDIDRELDPELQLRPRLNRLYQRGFLYVAYPSIGYVVSPTGFEQIANPRIKDDADGPTDD